MPGKWPATDTSFIKPGTYDQFIHKFGQNPDIDTGSVPEDIWPLGGVITWPTSAATGSIVSSSASDDGDPAGVGVQTLFIQGVDGSFARTSETITMNGTSAVTTANSYLFIDRMYAVTSGTSETNVGNITATIGGDVVAYISAGDGQTLQAAMVVPAYSGLSPYISQIWAGVGKAASAYCRLKLLRQPDGGSIRTNDDVIVNSDGANFALASSSLLPISAGDRIWWQVTESSTVNVEVFAGFEIAWK